MTIRRGEDWGEPGPLNPSSPVAHSDRELSRVVEARLYGDTQSGTATTPTDAVPVEVALLGGDLHRCVGSPQRSLEQLRAGEGIRLPIDVGVVEYSDPDSEGVPERRVFAAHLVAHVGKGRLWAGRTVIVMNGSFLGDANLGPRAHPNDGRLDVLDGELSFGDRRKAYKRMVAGTHVPHPALTELRVREVVLNDEKAFRIEVDGEYVGASKELRVRCEPDAAVIVV